MSMTAPVTDDSLGLHSALVLLHNRPAALWDTEVRQLTATVAERLDHVYVTSAGSRGPGPGLADALAAARYAGCDRAVLVSLDPRDGSGGLTPARGLRVSRATASWDADAIVRAFYATTPTQSDLPHAGAA